MPLCLSFFPRKDEAVLRNHAHYCRLFGYPHQWVEADRIRHPALRDSARYGQILRHLRALPENDWLLFLDGDSMVFHPIAIETLMRGRDALVVEAPPIGDRPGPAMTNMMVLRNTPANRAMLLGLMDDAGNVVALVDRSVDEAARLRPAGLLGCNAMVGDIYVNVSWRIPQWFLARIFVVHLGPLSIAAPEGVWREALLHDQNLQDMLAAQVNNALFHGQPVLQPAAYPALSEEPVSSYNADADIAFVTLYTHHVGSYARVSEHNVKRYCDRHGYAYHVYRAIPQAVDTGIGGSWVRSWLLQQHIAHHRWVIWIDADVLFLNQGRRIDALLEGRELLLAKDVGGWSFNSGVMGFLNTPGNAELLARIWQRIGEVDDKSAVYSSQGDQYYTNEVLAGAGLVNERSIVDNLSINTPPHLASDETLLVHFINLDEPYRSAYMASMDALSQRLR